MIRFNADTIALDNQKIKGFKDIDLEYWNNPKKFDKLIEYEPEPYSVVPAIQVKKSSFTNRLALVDILLEQHKELNNETLNNRIKAFNQDNTFAITSAHQPLFLGGTLYWWYKIIHTISLSIEFNKNYPDYNFIAIHYAGTEDHDYEEINHLSVFNKKIEWKNEGSGANGRRSTEGISDSLNEIKSLFQNNAESIQILDDIVSKISESQDYNDFHQRFFYSIFEKYNIIYFNPDDTKAKKLFTDIIQKEFDIKLVKENSWEAMFQLNQLGFGIQAHIHDLNTFYLKDNYRALIQNSENTFITKDKSYQWTEAELKSEITNYPERFSPNVALRPLYQEFVLPTVVFVGGGAEIAYWMQLKGVFKAVDISYPILWRRFSAIIYSQQVQTKIRDLGFEWEDFHDSSEMIFQKYISNHSQFKSKIDTSTEQILLDLDSHEKLSQGLDKSIENSISSDLVKLKQILEHINFKLLKAEKQKHDNALKKIEKIKDQIFPHQNLQERSESGLQYYLQYGDSFVEYLIKNSGSQNKAIGFLLKS